MASPPLPWLKPAVLVGGLAPLALLLLQGAQGSLGPNVIEAVLNETGLLALVFLVASLACTPLKLLFGWTWPVRVRKLVGLMAFTYAVLHFLTYAVADQGLALRQILEDITRRKFIAVGFIALVLLVPLAATSTNAAVRRMGFPAWQRLHRLVYVAAALGVVHFLWRVKKDATEPLIYGAVLTLLLGIRAVEAVRKRRRAREAVRPA
ncbi:MAG: sulfoxide reductase heme-binding subunit YedZ [Myxococcaceae bacterium]|nr:sulfoxide reductase heme-binding subunit YedZ [Myxococcaceae bacterium]